MAIMRWNASFPSLVREWFPRSLLLGDLAEFRLPAARYLPSMDVYTDGGDLLIKMELPEFKSEEVEIDLEDSCLTISGRHEHEEKIEEKDYYRRERYAGTFTRTVPLPREVKEEDIAANLKDGVLEVRVAGAVAGEVTEKKKIPIASS
ncbi:MAG: Hsp20/alpha crystallin family protein [Actinomycetota bacterium]